MSSHSVDGRPPAWVGVGAQRSGTTWLTQLLLQHPSVCLTGGSDSFIERKELHFFDGTLHSPPDGDLVADYHRLFSDAAASHPGEFTPSYLRSTWVAGNLYRAIGPDTVVFCILRDPVARFYSAVRWSRRLREQAPDTADRVGERGGWSRLVGGDAIWGGMYAAQLRAWRDLFGRDRLMVIQYEDALMEPAGAVNAIWSAMGLGPVELSSTTEPSSTALGDEQEGRHIERLPQLREMLQSIYRPQLGELEAEWGIDSTLWTSTT